MSTSTMSAVLMLLVSLVILAMMTVEGQRQPAQAPHAVTEAQAPPRGLPAPTAPAPNDPLAAKNAKPSSPAFAVQPDQGKVDGV